MSRLDTEISNIRAIRISKYKKIRNVLLNLVAQMPIPMNIRATIYKKIGAHIGKSCLIGNIHLDKLYPEDIYIGNGCTITHGVTLLTHFYDSSILTEHAYTRGRITIGDNVYIGMNTIFSKPVTVGTGAVIGAGSVVTRDIPPYEIWAGVPAKHIRKRYADSDNLPKIDNFKPI